MKKIPTLFEREYENHKVVGITDKLTSPNLQVVLDGKAIPTVKIDGSCVAVIDGKWYKRYDCKKGKKAPAGAIPCQDTPDEVTGHWPHWVELDETKPEDKWFIEAFYNYCDSDYFKLESGDIICPITYEAIGPHFQGNPYSLEKDFLYKHGSKVITGEFKHTFEGIKEYLKYTPIEGIVFWLEDPTGYYPICKIKRSDFGYEWPVPFKKEEK